MSDKQHRDQSRTQGQAGQPTDTNNPECMAEELPSYTPQARTGQDSDQGSGQENPAQQAPGFTPQGRTDSSTP